MVKVTAREPGTRVVWDEECVESNIVAVIDELVTKHLDVDIISENEYGGILIQQYRGGALESQGRLHYLLIVDDVDLPPVYKVFKGCDGACVQAVQEVNDYVASHPLIIVSRERHSLDCLSGREFFAASDNDKFHVEVREVSVPL